MTRMPRVLVFQHLDVEHPGIFRDFLEVDGIEWDMIELDQGDSIPDLKTYSALWVMGGPMDVWEETSNPWLIAEKRAIKHAIQDLNLGYFGICLGHQLLASALGGEVARGIPEVGVLSIELNAAGRASSYLSGLPNQLDCLQWHGAEITHIPEGATVLAHSEKCAVQAMSVGEKAFSAQFHIEVTQNTVTEWSAVPAYAHALEEALGTNALAGFQADVDVAMVEFNRCAKILYDNWMCSVGLKNAHSQIEQI